MRRVGIRIPAILAILAISSAAGWHSLGFKNWEWHQKLVLEVETPTGTVSGASVMAIRASTEPKWVPIDGAGGLHSTLEGESAFVEVAPGRYLFALLGNETSRVLSVFFPDLGPIGDERPALLERMRNTRDVPSEHYPLLVTFEDISEPATVKRVDPKNISEFFGQGTKLKRIALSITDEKVTKGEVERVLPWLDSIGRERATLIPSPPLLRKDAADPEIQYLTPGSFSTELYK